MDVPTIEQGLVLLRPLQPPDSAALYRWINDRATVVYNAPFAPVAREDHDRWFDAIRAARDVAIFGIVERATARLVGSCQLLNLSRAHRCADLQIRIGEPDARGRGLGTDAVRGLVRVGFETLHLHRIALTVRSDNARALKAYQRCGFAHEGLHKDAAYIEDRFVDLVSMAVLEP